MRITTWLKQFMQRRLAELRQAPPYPLVANEWAEAPAPDEPPHREKKPAPRPQRPRLRRRSWQYLGA